MFGGLTGQRLPPSHFGYWSIWWSDGHAEVTIDALGKGRLDGCSTYMQSYLTRLQLLALYTASYWAYAIHILGIPAEISDDMKKGLDDSIREFSNPDGSKISEDFVQVFYVFFGRMVTAIEDDFNNPPSQDAFIPDCNKVGQSFAEATQHYHFTDGEVMPEIERTYLTNMVASSPLELFQSLQEQKLKFCA